MKRLALLLTLLPALLDVPLQAAPERGDSPAAERRSRRMLRWMYRSNGVYSVLEAAQAGNAEVLKARLAEGADPNEVDEQGNRPIHLAAQGESPRVMEMLLAGGADPNAVDVAGRTALDLCEDEEMLELLRESARHRKKEIALDALVKSGDARGVKRALKAGVNPNARSADNKGTLVTTAVQTGQVEILRILLESGAEANTKLADGTGVLVLAVQKGNAQMLRMLLKAGADPMCPGRNGAYPLHDAVWHRNQELVKVLLPAYAKVNFSPHGGHVGYPINMAIWHAGDEFVKLFIDAGIDLNHQSFKGEYPLFFAAREGKADCVKMLLRAGASKKVRNREGKTPAEIAKPEVKNLLH